LGISNVKLIHGRAEDLGHGEFRESFDQCVARAVAGLPVLLEYCLPLVKPGGTVLAYKALSAGEEVEKAQNALQLLGAKKDVDIRPAAFYDEGLGHNVCVVSKVRRTPKTYPRGAGIVRKVPL
jgi:16S rRNA (guanine527-N7)-methyltransferase